PCARLSEPCARAGGRAAEMATAAGGPARWQARQRAHARGAVCGPRGSRAAIGPATAPPPAEAARMKLRNGSHDSAPDSAPDSAHDGAHDRDRVRIDVWLWRARFAKTRAAAARLVAEGGVRRIRDPHARRLDKPSVTLACGDVLVLPQ